MVTNGNGLSSKNRISDSLRGTVRCGHQSVDQDHAFCVRTE